MENKTALVLTTISPPNDVLKVLAQGCKKHGYEFVVIGDTKSPSDFYLEGCDYYSIDRQLKTEFRLATLCPTKHYARKNIGYLAAFSDGAEVIVETDDDNIPFESFWDTREKEREIPLVEKTGWLNIYRYYSNENVWPRGLPLDAILDDVPAIHTMKKRNGSYPIQQGLADINPDVDAIYRLTRPLPIDIKKDGVFALGKNVWCPFNSQNTTWWREAFPLLYLPAYCSFRMTDIWRSFVAQRIAWENEWPILFHGATVWQDRNEHDLNLDFEQEVPGYLNNNKIRLELERLKLVGGVGHICEDLVTCYESLVDLKVMTENELPLVNAWVDDLETIERSRSSRSSNN